MYTWHNSIARYPYCQMATPDSLGSARNARRPRVATSVLCRTEGANPLATLTLQLLDILSKTRNRFTYRLFNLDSNKAVVQTESPAVHPR